MGGASVGGASYVTLDCVEMQNQEYLEEYEAPEWAKALPVQATRRTKVIS